VTVICEKEQAQREHASSRDDDASRKGSGGVTTQGVTVASQRSASALAERGAGLEHDHLSAVERRAAGATGVGATGAWVVAMAVVGGKHQFSGKKNPAGIPLQL
jgi:hypothetical protein